MNNIYILVLINLILIIGFVLLYLYFTKKRDNTHNNTLLNSDSAKYKSKANKETFIELNKDFNTNDLINNYKNGATDYLLYDEITTHINNKLNESDGIISKMDVIKQKVKSMLSDNIMDLLPIGTIIMWNNDNLPLDKDGNASNKWAWCDGTNGTPNLKKRLPLGDNIGTKLSDTDIDTIFEKDAGGENIESTGKIGENNFPTHNHGGNGKTNAKEHNHVIGNSETSDLWQDTSLSDNISYHIYPSTGYHGSPGKTINISHSHNDTNEEGQHTHAPNTNTTYGVSADDQQPFYPRCNNINFIMKIM